MLVGYVVKLTSITALYVYMYLENKRRDRELPSDYEENTVVAGIEGGMLVSQPGYCPVRLRSDLSIGPNGA